MVINNKIYIEIDEDIISLTGPIRLYEKLGFTTRRKISFWQITK
jgi:hypothetical protein